MSDSGERRTRPLGPVQQHVLLVLDTRGASAATDWSAFYPMGEASVRSAINSLGLRGLVDVAGFTRATFGRGRDARTYQITDAGRAVVAEMVGDDDPEDLLDQADDSGRNGCA